MIDWIWKYLSIIGVASFKVMPGTAMGAGFGWGFLHIFLSTWLGGMAGIIFYSFWGTRIKRYFLNRKIKKAKGEPVSFNIKRARKFYRVYHRFGLIGIAAITPPFLTPPGGSIIAVSFGEDLRRILPYMAVSMAIWCGAFAYFADAIVAWLSPAS